MSDRVSSFGTIPAPRADFPKRGCFRIAVFGDFSGRSVNGVIDTGMALARRRPFKLDIDIIEQVVEGFATTLVLPIGKDRAGIKVELNSLDDLHPDQIFDNVEMFQELSGLKQRLATGIITDKTFAELQNWSETYSTKVKLPKSSAASAVPADRKLSDFHTLIKNATASRGAESPIGDLLARIVGPHIVAAPDQGIPAMQAAVDDALSNAMRLVLHHPDFQAVEALWRSLDLLARCIQTDENLEIVVYDVSAAEIAADLAASDSLDTSGLFQLLNGAGATGGGSGADEGGISATFGLYTFEETPPHAEILGRIAKIAAYMDAPFFTALSPQFLGVPIADRHPLVSGAWDRLRALPEANYLGVASPRFMLRRPYGSKSDPIAAFKYEEFSNTEGLSGLLWANPVVLVAILLAKTFTNDGWDMSLGSVMSLGDIPFHVISDQHGDQVALPCTERNFPSSKLGMFARRGIMPILSIKGRDEIRLASFHSVGGKPVFGAWSDSKNLDALELARRVPEQEVKAQLVLNGLSLQEEVQAESPKSEGLEKDEASLDELLASFAEDDDADADPDEDDEMDAELAALLEGL